MSVPWRLVCTDCAAPYEGLAPRYRCDCGGTLDVVHAFPERPTTAALDQRLLSRHGLDRSGVWRFREWVLPIDPASVVEVRRFRRDPDGTFAAIDPR